MVNFEHQQGLEGPTGVITLESDEEKSAFFAAMELVAAEGRPGSQELADELLHQMSIVSD